MKSCLSLLLLGAMLVVAPGMSNADIENLDIGGDVRTLMVWTDNIVDLNDDEDDQNDFLRLEAHIWFEATLADNVKAKVSFEVDRDWESNADVEGVETGSNGIFGGDSDLNVFLEEAWIKIAQIYDSPLSLTLGRQFIQFGDGFIIGDSQPAVPLYLTQTGEWEQDPFDAIVANFDWDTIILDLVYAKTVEEREADEDGDLAGAHLAYAGLEGHVFSIYYWFMRTESGDFARYPKLFTDGQENLHVIGGRAEGELFPTLNYVAEIAYQFGDTDMESGNEDISALGAHAGLTWRPDMELSPYIGFEYFFLQGDDDPELENEWRQVFSNHTYGEIAESYIASNMHMFNVNLGLDNIADGKFAAGLKYFYFLLDEDEGTLGATGLPTVGPGGHPGYEYHYQALPFLTGDDSDFGHEIDLYLTYNFSDSLVAKVVGGVFIPGDAIETFNDDEEVEDADEAFFARAEVAVKF